MSILLRLILTLLIAISPTQRSGESSRFGLPPTGEIAIIPSDTSTSTTLPTLKSFSTSIVNGSGALSGVYAPGLFAFPITQQPNGDAGYVSAKPDVLTQFRMASQYNTIGLLAHDYLAGAAFENFQVGQDIVLIFGNGSQKYYQVYEIRQFQALTPTSAYSDFVDLASQKRMSVEQLFYQTYGLGNRLIFQTCISKNKISSWGRLFILAKPVDQPAPIFEKVAPIIPAILESLGQALGNMLS